MACLESDLSIVVPESGEINFWGKEANSVICLNLFGKTLWKKEPER
jgi:hypothetical protein